MPRQIPEPDWKVFRRLHKLALERFAEQSLEKVNQALAVPEETTDKTFLKLFHLVNERNDEVARLFDDFRRSTARIYLRLLRSEV